MLPMLTPRSRKLMPTTIRLQTEAELRRQQAFGHVKLVQDLRAELLAETLAQATNQSSNMKLEAEADKTAQELQLMQLAKGKQQPTEPLSKRALQLKQRHAAKKAAREAAVAAQPSAATKILSREAEVQALAVATELGLDATVISDLWGDEVLDQAVKELRIQHGLNDAQPAANEAEELAGIGTGVFDVPTPRREAGDKQQREDEKAAALKTVLSYFGVWEPAPLKDDRIRYMELVLLPRIPMPQLVLALTVRGKAENDTGDVMGTKLELVTKLAAALNLERKFLGLKRQKHIRSLEGIIAEHEALGQFRRARALRGQILQLWGPLGTKQQGFERATERVKAARAEAQAIAEEEEYLKRRLKSQAAMHVSGFTFTTSLSIASLLVTGSSSVAHAPWQKPSVGHFITVLRRLRPRFQSGYAVRLPRCRATACALHPSVRRNVSHVPVYRSDAPTYICDSYSWGDGSFGRLGHGDGPSGRELGRSDRKEPSRILELAQQSIMMVRCTLASH